MMPVVILKYVGSKKFLKQYSITLQEDNIFQKTVMDLQFTLICFLIIISPMKFANADPNCIGHVCIPKSYDMTILPLQNEINQIDINFINIRIIKVDDEESTITLSLWLQMYWKDSRLIVKSHSEDSSRNNHTFTPLNSAIINRIWVPAPYILDLKNIESKSRILYLKNENVIYHFSDLEIILYCPMVFDNYPIGKNHTFINK